MTATSRRSKAFPAFSLLVREELIDRLLIQELICDPQFAKWFTGRVLGRPACLGALHQSKTRRGRETDVEVHCVLPDSGERVLILVENKINAAFQPEQLEDYHFRGQGLVRDGKCDRYVTVLMAPSRYLSGTSKNVADLHLPYEELLAQFDSTAALSAHSQYAAEVVMRAIGKGERVYQGVADLAVTDFWSQYLAHFQRSLPGWAPHAAKGTNGGRPEKSDIVYLYPPGRGTKGLRITHKLKKRELELSFEGIGNRKAEFEAMLRPHIRPPMTLEWSGAKGAVRVAVPRVSPWDPLAPQLEEVNTAIAHAKRLVDWFEPLRDAWLRFRGS